MDSFVTNGLSFIVFKNMEKIEVKKGERYGRLIILSEEEKIKKARIFRCLCDCGKETTVRLNSLRQGRTRSCGCLRSELIKERMEEEGNPMWKGDEVGYGALHLWVTEKYPKKEVCECCGKVDPCDLANKGIYNRELKNWEWLCRKCHMVKDGRLKRFAVEKTITKRDSLGRIVSSIRKTN